MSGIAGIYNLDSRQVDPALLKRMTDTMAHRGPDGEGHWIDGPVGLGHRMLHTTPESLQEKQPLVDETGNLCLTFDGRVDNREELRAALEDKGAKLRTDTDAELVLRAYEYFGEDCPKRILGDFAFVIWDKRNRQLFCARDPLGMKPFYYHTDGRRFIFGSEMQPLFAEPTLPRKPNLSLIGLYLLNRFGEREETLYEGIYRLPHSHALIVKESGLQKVRYWDIDPFHEIRYPTESEYAEHFLDLFQTAVQSRLRSHGPVGVLLSGGLDSSSIVCTAQKLYRESIVPDNGFETFSLVFDELPCDERSYIGEVVRKWGVKANFITYEQDPFWVAIDHTAKYPDVFYEPMLFMYGAPFSDMRNRGIRVLLDGVGGDELLAAGFDHLTDLVRARHFRALIHQLRHDANIYCSISPLDLFVKYCLKPMIPSLLKAALRPLAKPFLGNGIPSFVRPEFLRETGLNVRLKAGVVVTKFPTSSQQVIYNGLFFGWNPIVAAEMNDLFSAQFSVEHRRPFLDRRLVEFLLAVPEEQRWQGDQPKMVLRQAMDGILPEPIRRRKGKAEFSSPIDRELKHRQADKVERLFRTSILAALGVIDADKLLRLFRKYRRGSRQYLTGTIEVALELELWCRSAMGATGEEIRY